MWFSIICAKHCRNIAVNFCVAAELDGVFLYDSLVLKLSHRHL